MDMSNLADIVVSNVDIQPINDAIKQRAQTLGEQLNPEAANQFISDMSELICSVKSDNNVLSFDLKPSEAYLINYLKLHSTPVTGGDSGTVHDVDGSTYESNVPHQLWGTELPWYEMPTIDGEDEAYHIVELMSRDAALNAVRSSKDVIADTVVKPYVQQEFYELLGGGSL